MMCGPDALFVFTGVVSYSPLFLYSRDVWSRCTVRFHWCCFILSAVLIYCLGEHCLVECLLILFFSPYMMLIKIRSDPFDLLVQKQTKRILQTLAVSDSQL